MSADAPRTRSDLGYLLIFVAATLWALLGVFSQRLLTSGVPALEIAYWRAALAGVVFIVHAGVTRQLRLRRGTDLLAFAAFALVGVTLFYSALNFAIDAGGISLAFVLLYTAPAFVAVLAAIFLGERLTGVKIALVCLSIVGVILVSGGGGTGVTPTWQAVAWGLTAGASYSSYYLFGKWSLRTYAPVTVFAYVMPIGALGLLPFVGFTALTVGGSAVWLDIVPMALFSTYLAYLVYYTGLRTIEASRAVLVATIEPVLAALFAAALFGERLSTLGVIGGLLVLTAAIGAATLRRRTRGA
ncbi:MAG TPA: DMT family transporter [Trueperaceae bacterium]|nr:DMT family transporter [Trueperaceae bacterium]